MSRRLLLSPLTIIGVILFLAVGEVASGTALPFVGMMSLAMLAICVTYNMLGGLGTIGGVLFAAFAVYTLVLSQFAKVFMFEAADLNLRAPQLTIAVYAVFFLSLMVGVFLFAWIRLDLPKPLEPSTETHSGVMYGVSLVLGLAGRAYMINSALANPEMSTSLGHGVARAFAALLPLSLVIAVDARIRRTEGRQCFGWAAFWPAAAIELFGFAAGSRLGYVLPPGIVFVTGYLRGFRFRLRHYVVAAAMTALLFLFVSPWYLWTRDFRDQPNLWREIATMSRLAAAAPQHWQQVTEHVGASMQTSHARAGEYFSKPGTYTLNRLILIPDDGAVIGACSHYHWGPATVKIDVANSIPHFLMPKKPDRDGTWFRASVGGLQSSYEPTSYVTTSMIADAWGGFSWAGVIVVPLLLLPLIFIVYDSIFDMSRPWGTVVTLTSAMGIAITSIGGLAISFLLYAPISVLLVSWFTGWIVRSIPLSGDNPRRRGVPLFSQEKVRSIAGD
jgi:hypothetical protein